MQLFSPYFATIIVLAFIASSPVLAQRNFRQQQQRQQQQQQGQYCVTPENYYGSCVVLSYCPQIANVFNTLNPRQAQQYVIQSQRACGQANINGDPVVCCSSPQFPAQQQFTDRPQRQTQSPATRRPTNPFFPTEGPEPEPVTQAPPPPPPTTTTARPTSAPAIDPKAVTCRGPDSRDGNCLALVQCTSLLTELQQRPTDAAFQNFLRASNRICGGTGTNVCCPSSNNVQPTTPAIPLIRNTDEIPRRLPTVEEGCGYTTKSFKKIVGGEVSQKGSWPWITLIGYDDGLSASPFKCGGALVTARHVVTAAHCIRRDLTFVRLGEHDLTTDSEAHHVDIKVVRTEKHPNYTPKNGHSDIAILYLERNVDFSVFISPICLPTTPELRKKSYVKYTPFVTGWGKTMEGGMSANVLQELQIPIYDNAICRDRYQKQGRLFTENQFDAAVICAGVLSGGKDTCQGDSGGPLMLPESYKGGVRFYLIGVVSYGIGCARPEIPGVYSSTQYFVDWIIEKVANTP